MCDTSAEQRRAGVSEYYGEVLKGSEDLRTSACCPIDAVPKNQRDIVSKLHPEVVKRFYGCGSPIPSALKGATVLDLGCGTGRDAYVASGLVGPQGKVIGVDMTPAQLKVAREYQDYHAKALLGPDVESNVEFREGVIEDLRAAGIDDRSIDVVISNCVCNLTADKTPVWREIARVLRDGGELYFSDVYSDRRLSPEAQKHEVLIAECLGGAMYLGDFRRSLREAGFHDVRIVTSAPIQLHDDELRALVPDVTFYSVTVRAFKASGLEEANEDYGQTVRYTGCAKHLTFDADFTFPSGVDVPVDGNTASIIAQSRYSKQFKVSERGPHRGLFAFSSGSCRVGSLLYGLRATEVAKLSNGVSKHQGLNGIQKDEAPSVSALNSSASRNENSSKKTAVPEEKSTANGESCCGTKCC